MPTETLRLGIDPRPAQKGSREYRRAIDEAAGASDRLATKVEANAKRETSIYQRAAAERLQLERQIASRRTSQARVSATAAAEAFVRAQESYYQTNIARIRAAQARGLMSPSDARTAGQQAALEYNNAILGALDRPQYAQNRRAFTTLAGSIKNIDEAGRSAGVGMHRLNNSLIVLARQATGTHPVVGQLVDVVGTFAIGTAAMVPILAGIAAIAAGIAAITRESREAKQELADARDRLREIGEERRIAAAGGQTAVDVAAIERRIADLHRQIDELRAIAASRAVDDPGIFETRIRALRQQIQELFGELGPGRAQIGEEGQDERIRQLNRLAERQRALVFQRLDDSAVAARAERELVEITTRHEEEQRRAAAERAADAARSRTDAIEEALGRELEAEEQAAEERRRIREEEQREEERRLRELERARERALRSLVRGLYEVGRAFGGTTDQILSMTAAILSLERVPMQSGRDRLVGYGSAALTGAGFGASTGSPALGALGGAAGGFAIAGPAGAIVGGVSGIVTGLMEQGRRARVAAAQWKVAFSEFETMFEDLTPTEQRQQQLDRAFAQAVQAAVGGGTSIATIEEARALLRAVDEGRPGLGETEEIERLRRLVQAYDRNSERLDENTDALNTVTGALNAPTGFRQSYYRWLAQGVIPIDEPRGPGTGGTGTPGRGGWRRGEDDVVYASVGRVDIQVTGAGDPEATAEAVKRVFEREALLGGAGPLELTRR